MHDCSAETASCPSHHRDTLTLLILIAIFFFPSDIPHTWGILYLLIIILKMAHSVSLKPKHVTVCQFALWMRKLDIYADVVKEAFFFFLGKVNLE